MFEEGDVLNHIVGGIRIRIEAVDNTNLEYRISPASSSIKSIERVFTASFSIINTWYKLCPQHEFNRDLENILEG